MCKRNKHHSTNDKQLVDQGRVFMPYSFECFKQIYDMLILTDIYHIESKAKLIKGLQNLFFM